MNEQDAEGGDARAANSFHIRFGTERPSIRNG